MCRGAGASPSATSGLKVHGASTCWSAPKNIPDGQALRLAIEGSTVEFDCPDTDDQGVLREHLHTRIRLINLLIREAGGRESQP
jgi:hypothetical protein